MTIADARPPHRSFTSEGSQEIRPRSQVPVAELEPGVATEAGDGVEGVEGVAGDAPTSGGVGQLGQRVEDGVEVRADPQAVEVEVVGGVDDDRQAARINEGVESPQEARRPHTASQRCDSTDGRLPR